MDRVRNCEDLALPMLISQVSGTSPVTVRHTSRLRMNACALPACGYSTLVAPVTTQVEAPGVLHLQDENEAGHHQGLNKLQGHYQTRTDCLNEFEKWFGGMTLRYSNFKVAPLGVLETL